MPERILTFHIDTEVTEVYVKDLLRFIRHYYLRSDPDHFSNIRTATVNSLHFLTFRVRDPQMRWYVDVVAVGSRPIKVTMTSSDETIPEDLFEQLRDDLVIYVQLFEEQVRKTTLYFAWVEGKDIIPETLPSVGGKATDKIFTGNMLYLYVIMIIASFFLFGLLGIYTPIAIIAFQLAAVLFADKIALRFGNWRIDPENPTVHLLQYHLPIEEYREFRNRYGTDLVLKIKREIYEKTLAVGKEPSCELGQEVLSKYGMQCVPERMSAKTVNVYALVKRVAQKFQVPIPKIAISNTMLPNAAATGPSPSHGTVLITTGLLMQLEEDELVSVVGHEVGHLKGRDSLILFGLIASEYLLRLYVLLPIFYLSPFLYLIVTMGIIYFVAKFFEARADLQSAIVIGQPQSLAEALRKIGFRKLQFERTHASRILGWLNWDPHPPMYFRISRLDKLKAPVKIKHPLIQSAKDVVDGFRAAL
jgi:heat shock protein HtpX